MNPTDPFLPEHMRRGMQNYLEHGIEPGSFLSAVLCNDLKGAVGAADHINLQYLTNIVAYCYNEIPAECWGSEDKFNRWVQLHLKKRMDECD